MHIKVVQEFLSNKLLHVNYTHTYTTVPSILQSSEIDSKASTLQKPKNTLPFQKSRQKLKMLHDIVNGGLIENLINALQVAFTNNYKFRFDLLMDDESILSTDILHFFKRCACVMNTKSTNISIAISGVEYTPQHKYFEIFNQTNEIPRNEILYINPYRIRLLPFSDKSILFPKNSAYIFSKESYTIIQKRWDQHKTESLTPDDIFLYSILKKLFSSEKFLSSECRRAMKQDDVNNRLFCTNIEGSDSAKFFIST